MQLCACGTYALKFRKSQILNEPSSLPDTMRYDTSLLQLMTFTSASCARTVNCALPRARVSQMRTVLSTLQEANTVASFGLHCKSSTDPLCDRLGLVVSTFHTAPSSAAVAPSPIAAAAVVHRTARTANAHV